MLSFCELYYFKDSFILVYLWVWQCWVFYIEFTFCAALALGTEWQWGAPSHFLAHILTHDISFESLKRTQITIMFQEGLQDGYINILAQVGAVGDWVANILSQCTLLTHAVVWEADPFKSLKHSDVVSKEYRGGLIFGEVTNVQPAELPVINYLERS